MVGALPEPIQRPCLDEEAGSAPSNSVPPNPCGEANRMSRSTRIPMLGLAVALLALNGAVLGVASAQAAAGCQVTYTKTNEWTTSPGQGGFGANLTVQNLGDPLTSWTLRFSFPATQQLTGAGWGATWSQSGPDMT